MNKVDVSPKKIREDEEEAALLLPLSKLTEEDQQEPNVSAARSIEIIQALAQFLMFLTMKCNIFSMQLPPLLATANVCSSNGKFGDRINSRGAANISCSTYPFILFRRRLM